MDLPEEEASFPVVLVPIELDQQRFLVKAQPALARLVDLVQGVLGNLEKIALFFVQLQCWCHVRHFSY